MLKMRILEGPEDDSIRIETCCPNTIINIINVKYTIMCQTQHTFIMFFIVLGQHVSILIESSSGLSKKIDPYLKMLKCTFKNRNMLP